MSGVKIHSFTFNAFQENTFVLFDQRGDALIVDPGCYSHSERMELQGFIHENKLNVQGLLNTHGHIDHVLGNQYVTEQYRVGLGIHQLDLETLERVEQYAQVYGFDGYVPSPSPSYLVSDQEKLMFGDMEITVLFTPGHTPGHVVYYLEKEGLVINGDVLFQGSFGRTDLPGGDFDTLKDSIFNVLFQLPEDTQVYCGHGPSTTIKMEKRNNYILQF